MRKATVVMFNTRECDALRGRVVKRDGTTVTAEQREFNEVGEVLVSLVPGRMYTRERIRAAIRVLESGTRRVGREIERTERNLARVNGGPRGWRKYELTELLHTLRQDYDMMWVAVRILDNAHSMTGAWYRVEYPPAGRVRA